MIVLHIQIEVGIGHKVDVAIEVHGVVSCAPVDGQARQVDRKVAYVDDVVAGSGIDGDGCHTR